MECLFAGTSSPTEAVIMMVLCPPLAIRSVATLSRDLLARFHPLAAAAVLCTRSSFTQMAGQVLRDLHHPTAPIPPAEEHRRIEASFRALLIEAVEELVRRQGIDPGELLAPPQPTDDCAWYCPRCHGQLRVRHSQCPDCPGVALHSFDHDGGGS